MSWLTPRRTKAKRQREEAEGERSRARARSEDHYVATRAAQRLVRAIGAEEAWEMRGWNAPLFHARDEQCDVDGFAVSQPDPFYEEAIALYYPSLVSRWWFDRMRSAGTRFAEWKPRQRC